MRYSLTPLVLVASVSAATIKIDVGEDGLSFEPSSVKAAVGDKLEFRFYAATGPHTVVEGSFDSPCVPSHDAFFSGLLAGTNSGSDTFTVDVTSTDPIWYYCSASRHCEAGMVGVVNAPSGQTQEAFASKAANARLSSEPSAVSGGVVGTGGSSPSSSSSSSSSPPHSHSHPSSSSSSASIASTTSPTVSSTTSAPDSSSTGSVAASVSSVASSVSRSASSAASSASSAAAASTSSPSIAGRNDGKVAGALAAVAGGLVALLV